MFPGGRVSTATLRGSALKWLAQREHSRTELRRKLLWQAARLATGAAAAHAEPPSMGEPGFDDEPATAAVNHSDAEAASSRASEVDALLEALAEKGLLSDVRFIESRIQARAQRYGNRRIEGELAQHKLVLDATDKQLLAASELQRAQAVWARKFRAPAADAGARAKQMRFLAARGFSMDVIRKVLAGEGDADAG